MLIRSFRGILIQPFLRTAVFFITYYKNKNGELLKFSVLVTDDYFLIGSEVTFLSKYFWIASASPVDIPGDERSQSALL